MGKKLTYEKVKEYIENFGYKLISKEYTNAHTKMEYECPKGHEFFMSWANFQQGQRCSICKFEKQKLTYEQVKKYIESFGYKLLSTEYINSKTKMKMQCTEVHEFYATFNSFQCGNRCPICRIEKLKHTYEQVKEYIEKFPGYKLISKEYTNSRAKIKYKCPEGHEFLMTLSNFQQGRRCPICANEKLKHTYEQVKEYIEKFPGYKLISKEYINAHIKMNIQCPEGHEFYSTFNNFQQGKRCPECSNNISKSEKEMLEYVKSLTKELIVENDRTQIVNPLTGHNLELDIYIPSLNKAIEFNGDYWHCNPNFYEADYWHIQKKMHAYQIWNWDRKKMELCKEKGIDLLVIKEEDWIYNIKSSKKVLGLFFK